MTAQQSLQIIRDYMLLENISESEMARRLGFQQKTFWYWMNDDVEPKGLNRQRLERKARELKKQMDGGNGR